MKLTHFLLLPPCMARPEIQETKISYYSINSSEFTCPGDKIVLSGQGVSERKLTKQIANGECIIYRETQERLENVLHHCLNINGFDSMTALMAWVLITGYKVPIITKTTILSPIVEPEQLAKCKTILFYPILKFEQDQHLEYAMLISEYFYQRFPQRTFYIKNQLLRDTTLTSSDWIQKAHAIFTGDHGHSVMPSIFDSDPEVCGLVPPIHASKMQKSTPHKGLYVLDPKHRMQCLTCKTLHTWQFAYKHCQCTQILPQCFACALKEWQKAFNQAEIITTHNQDITLVQCQLCKGEWSLFSLLHVQGNQNWFSDRPIFKPLENQDKSQVNS